MVWGCFAGDTVGDLLVLTRMAITAFCSDMPSHLVCTWWDHHLFSNKTMTPNTPLDYVGAICPRRRVMECCIR